MEDEERKRQALSRYVARLRSLNYFMTAVIVVLFLGLFVIVAFTIHAP